MSDESNAAPNGAAANAAPAIQAQPAPVAAPPAVQANDDPNNPPWLPERLARERKTAAKEAEANARKLLLEELGGDPDSIKKLLADEKKRAEAQKTLETKVAERDAALNAKDARNKELESSVKVFADGQLSSLSESQKAAVLKVAGDDPAKQLNAIEALRPTWAAVAPVAPAQAPNAATPVAVPPVVAAPPARPATATAPPANAPPPAGSSVVENRLETFTAMNDPQSPTYAPFAAAAFYGRYRTEIEAAKKSRGASN